MGWRRASMTCWKQGHHPFSICRDEIQFQLLPLRCIPCNRIWWRGFRCSEFVIVFPVILIPNHCDFSGCPRWMWLKRQSSLPSADLTTLTGNAVYSCNLQSQGERHWMSSQVAGRHIQLCISPSLLILPDLLTHYVLKPPHFNSLYQPLHICLFHHISSHRFALVSRLAHYTICFYLKSCTNYPAFGEKICLYNVHTLLSFYMWHEHTSLEHS